MFFANLFYLALLGLLTASAASALAQWRAGERLHSLLFLFTALVVLYIEGDAVRFGQALTASFSVLWVLRVLYLLGCVYYLWQNGALRRTAARLHLLCGKVSKNRSL